MRVKGRYVLFRVIYDDNQQDATLVIPQLAKSIQLAVEQCFGDWGSGAQRNGFQLKYYQPMTGLGIARFPRDVLRTMVYAMTQIKKLNQKSCKLDILHISGTIKKCQLTAVELSRKYLKELAQITLIQQIASTTKALLQSTSKTPIDDTASALVNATITLTNDGDVLPGGSDLLNKIQQMEEEINNIDNTNTVAF